MCETCVAAEATISPSIQGTCVCGLGFVSQTSPTTACMACTNGSVYCLSGSDTYNWKSAEVFQFVVAAHSLDASLPYLTTTHHLLCYRINVDYVIDCTIPAINAIDGSFINGAAYEPASNQCSAILGAL